MSKNFHELKMGNKISLLIDMFHGTASFSRALCFIEDGSFQDAFKVYCVDRRRFRNRKKYI